MRGIREGREDVYLVREKRIRFHRQTYTFCSQDLYVAGGKGIRWLEVAPYCGVDRRNLLASISILPVPLQTSKRAP